MRIGGLASGIDTESIIRDLMKAERMPLEKLNQKKTYLEWQLDDYRSVNRQLNDFSDLLFNGVMKQSTFIQKTVNVSAPNDVAIRNVNSTSDFTGTINVQKLAKTATMHSSGPVVASEADLTKPLTGVTVPSSFTIKAINKDGVLDAGYEVKIDAKSTLKSVIDDINKNSGVTAIFDSYEKKIVITAKHSGDIKDPSLPDDQDVFSEIQFSGDFAFLKLESDNIAAASNGTGTLGENAVLTINGLATERTSNTFQVNGFEFSLKAAKSSDINFSSSADTEKILESVVKFVDEYNKLIEDLNNQIREPKYRSYQPLSQEQKNEMKEREVELWEEKAKSGTLRNDSIVSSLLNEMRLELQGAVTGKGTLKDIGIEFSKEYTDRGKLIINESKLREAISTDPNKLYEIFTANGDTTEDKGFARRIRETVDASRKEIAARAGKVGSTNASFVLGKNLESMNNQIDRFEDRLKMVENRYWRQFTAMESAIQRANAQSAYLANAFGGGM